MRFSQRKGLQPIRVTVQREDIDAVLRTKLWSALQIAVFSFSEPQLRIYEVDSEVATKRLWLHFFHRPIDTAPEGGLVYLGRNIREWFFKCEWFEVYDFIESVHSEMKGVLRKNLSDIVNSFLESEMSAYRLIDGQVAEITSEEEISAIEDAIADTRPMLPVRTHLRDALSKLTDRKEPDYRNSIKESISAVEAMCQIITGNSKATLGQAIKDLKNAGVKLHPSLEQAWLRLYGYTSDAGGIRHALADEGHVGFSDAKYMLVSCSAFISHLFEVSRTAGLELSS